MAELRCAREREVLDELTAGRAIDINPELQQHVARCCACTELVAVAGALLDDKQSLMAAAELPGSGLVWWKATMRARQAAAKTAARTARAIQAALLVTAFVIGAIAVGWHITAAQVKTVLAAAPYGLATLAVPLLAIVGWLILAPVALYFVVNEE